VLEKTQGPHPADPDRNVTQSLPEAATLTQELLNFKAKPSTAPLDSLVLATVTAAWICERAMLRLRVDVYQGQGW
jgi:hypothetical protein